VLDYLDARPDPEKRPSDSNAGKEGVAAAAVTLRWGSYFCVLADRTKPLWGAVTSSAASRISDEEMARINIEASAALAEWIDLHRADPDRHALLVERALTYLPMSTRTAEPTTGALRDLSDPGHAGRLLKAAEHAWGAEPVERARLDVRHHATRVLANAAVNVAWRCGPVEDIHAGRARHYPLDERRVTPDEEHALMCFASDRTAEVMAVCERLASERHADRPARSWAEQVLPYALAKMMLVTPVNWTLTEVSREVRFHQVKRSPRSAP
jgi:hypothetical protein